MPYFDVFRQVDERRGSSFEMLDTNRPAETRFTLGCQEGWRSFALPMLHESEAGVNF